MSQTEPKEKREGLSGKAWTAIVCTGLFFCTLAWVVASVLTATPSIDPTVHADAVALANSQQPDPDAPSRYGELVEALRRFESELDRVEDEVAHERGGPGSGAKMLDFTELLYPPDPTDNSYYESHAAGAEDARRAAHLVLERDLFRDIPTLLQSPNLAHSYDGAFDDSGNLLPMYNWATGDLTLCRSYATAVVGTARALSESGRSGEAAELLAENASLPIVLTRHITLVDHIVGYSIAILFGNEVEHMIVHSDLDRESLDTLLRVHDQLSGLGPVSVAIHGETLMFRDVHFRTHTAGGRYIPSVTEAMMDSSSSTSADPDIIAKLEDSWGYLAARRDGSMAVVHELHSLTIEASEEFDPGKRHPLIAAYDRKVDALGWRTDLLLYISGYLGNVVESSFDHRARITALGILLAMAEYRFDSGDWPTTLDQLVPDYLDTIPTNPVTGDPFEYDHEAGEPPSLERLGVGF